MNLILNLTAIILLLSQHDLSLTRVQSLRSSALVFNLVTFVLCVVLQHTTMEVGIALGLFAMFGIIRYRSEPVDMGGLSLLFAAVGLGLLNGMSTDQVGFIEQLVFNAILVLSFHFGRNFLQPKVKSMIVHYDHLSLLKPANLTAFKADMRERLDIDVESYEMIETDFLRDAASIRITYR